MLRAIDINSDVGERPDALADGREEELIRRVTSANIACGAHAGVPKTMARVIELCRKHGVAIGAHPAFPDRVNFGRLEMDISLDEIERSVYEQVGLLIELARGAGCRVRHVKPHGALYTAAVRNPAIAAAISSAVGKLDKLLILMGLSGSGMLEVWRAAGFSVAAEAFADRRYEADGSLRSRKHPDAVIADPMVAAEQAVRLITQGVIHTVGGSVLSVDAQTLCVHSDTGNAIEIVDAIRERLLHEGIRIQAL